MTNVQKLEKVYMLVNAIKMAREKDHEFQINPRKRKDGTEDWSAAGFYFGELFGEKLDWSQMCNLDYNSAIALR